ncbi:hypothetical protein HLB23_29195 [Nocardia uniformis]|uniref:Mce-associated membrane protein n=1 Tax=Nocardia uniformis TaxID=53432 RepID=A0A849C580_9NOCA|nr:hypothetical protein [Nocardia uniformis]NNH73883.1 hypothetical protein [Nocardia uniformis]
MSDDAAQDKTTENDSTAKAETGGSADTTAKPETEATTEVKAAAEPKSDTAAEPKADTTAEPEAAATPSLDKKSDAPAAVPAAKVREPKAATPAPAPAAAGAGVPASLPLIGAFAAGVLLVASIATGTWFFMQNRTHVNELAARDDAKAAACEFGKAVSNYDAKNLDEYFDSVNSKSTGQWGQFFGGATDALKEAMQSVNARSTLDEIHCAYESGDENKAQVVLIITQVRSNSVVQAPDMLTVSGVADMEKKDGKWLVANFDSPALKGLAPTGNGQQTEQPAPTTEPAPAPGN